MTTHNAGQPDPYEVERRAREEAVDRHPRPRTEPINAEASSPADEQREERKWQCPDGVAHMFDIVLDEQCVETIQRLTADPSGNDPALRSKAADYRMQAGGSMWYEPRPGELLRVTCSKCGREAVVSLGWTGASPSPACR